MSKLPECAFQADTFYWKARGSIPGSADEPWYTKNPVGHNILAQFLKRMLDSAGIDSTNKTNHSLRATAISHMFQSSVAQKVVKERSGHLSKEGLTPYERTTAQQQKAVCKVLGDASCSSRVNSNSPNSLDLDQDQFPVDRKPPVEAFERKPDASDLMKNL